MGTLRDLDPEAWRPDLLLLVASCVLLLLGYFMSAAIWGWIVGDLGGGRIPVRRAIPLFMTANLGRYVPGKVWQIAGLAVLARREGVPAATATAGAVLAQGFALASAMMVGMGALLAGPPEARQWGIPVAAVVGVGVVVGLIPAVFRRLAAFWFRLARQEAPASLGSGHAAAWLVASLANWALYAFSFWVLAASFGHAGHPVAVASGFAAAYVIGYLMLFAPAGVGVREGALVAFLSPWMGGGDAAILAVVARVWTTAVEVVPAGAFWLRHVTAGRNDVNTEDDGG